MDIYEQISLLCDLQYLCFDQASRLESEADGPCGPAMRRLCNKKAQKLRHDAVKLGAWKEKLEQQARKALTGI